MKLALSNISTSPTTDRIICQNSAVAVGDLQQRSNEKGSFESGCDRICSPGTTAAALSLPKLERFPDYFRDTMDWLIGRSRRKGPAAGATGQVGCDADHSPSSMADKENVDYRDAGSKKRATVRDGTAVSSCSSGSSGGAEDAVTRRFHKQQRKAGQRDGTAIRESRSADLASVSSASGAGTLGVCDTITETDVERLVKLPPGMGAQEWMASHALALFHHVNALYGAVCELCTKESCPVMNGPGNIQFQWVDDKNRKVKCPAPQYVDCVMSFAERMVRSEETFPTKFGNDFPANFDSTVKKLCRLLYHVLSHLHVAHLEHLRLLGVGSQAAAVHWHLSAFARHFQMLESKDAAGLVELTINLRRMNVLDDSAASAAAVDIGCEGNDADETGQRDDGCGESPPRLQETNAQLQ